MKNSLHKTLLAPAAAGVLACAALYAVWFHTAAQGAQATAAPAPLLVREGHRLSVPAGSPLRERLQVAAATEGARSHVLSLPATVEADPARTVNILPPLAGRLLELKVRLGDAVRAGQLLATMASPDLAQAVADAQKARDALALAERALARAQGVNEAGSNAAKDVEAARSAVVQQTAELRRSEARLHGIGASAGDGRVLRIVAPMAGTVTALNAASGAVLNDANAALMTVSNLERVWVTVGVPEDLLGLVAAGQNATVTLASQPGRRFAGQVAFVSAALDADTRRARARIVFANPEGVFKPNMYASAALELPQAAQPQVPSSALLMNNDSVSVFVEVQPWTFERRAVELGREDGDRVRIRGGLAAGERVVVRGGVLLND
ncbi:efflux RND transporter periplasmic adaptor subunit [Variovorax sp.]|uniref:efflux RND transporter periplasmic adaptor subunit n=1 Tax=Variovorax sp. TaxID=1871043 RepID=UPI0037D99558